MEYQVIYSAKFGSKGSSQILSDGFSPNSSSKGSKLKEGGTIMKSNSYSVGSSSINVESFADEDEISGEVL